MKKDAVPQEIAVTYGGQRKLLYAVDERGEYGGVHSAGWEVETTATLAAVTELNRLRDDAWQRARAGETSALEYHMYRRRMEPATLAAATGLWRWRIRRHFNPARFSRLAPRLLRRYAQVLDLSPAELQQLPTRPDID